MGWAPVLLKSPARNAKVSKVQDKTLLHLKLCKKCFSSTVFPGKCFSCPDIREKSSGLRKSRYSRKVLWPQKSSGKVWSTLKSSRKVCVTPEKFTMVMPTETSNGSRAISLDCQARAAKAACNHVASLCLLFFTHFL